MTSHKMVGIFWQAVAYFLAVSGAVLTYAILPDFHIIVKFLISDVVGTIIIFCFSRKSGNSSFYDPYWSLQPVVIAFFLFFYFVSSTPVFTRQSLVLILVLIYGIRLTFNFFRGWPGLKEQDWRYDDLKSNHPASYWWVSFGGIHLFPTLLVFGGCLSLFIIYLYGENPWNWLDAIAFVWTLSAIGLEAIADEQLYGFRKKSTSKNTIMDKGLWGKVRYPNYLGEILFWWGLYLFVLASNPAGWWTIIGPLGIHALFLYISIPLKDKRMLERRPSYKELMKRIPALVPRFK